MLASAFTSLPNLPRLSLIQRKWLSRRRWYPSASTTFALRQASVNARASAMVLAIGLSRKVCLPALAAATVVSRCTELGVVLMIASMLLSCRISSYDLAARQPYFFANASRFSAEREKQETILSFPERLMASASTSDHHPMPRQATFKIGRASCRER